MTSDKFEPRILGFLCNWCCYAAADSAGVARYQYPPNIRVIRVMCSGRVDPVFILDAFFSGADGVFVGGCHLGECHYLLGNYDAMVTAELVRGILKEIGVNPGRFTIEWASAAEGMRYVELITAFTKKIKEMGPLGQVEGKDKDELLLKLGAARSTTEDRKLRIGLGRVTKDFRKKGDYGHDVIKKKVEEKLASIMRSEVGGHEIILRLERQGPLSVNELAGKVDLSAEEIAGLLGKLGKRGLVAESDECWMLVKTGDEVV